MPCNDCGKQKEGQLPRGLNSNLDRAILAMTAAWITDLDPEERDIGGRVVAIMQDLAKPHAIPLEFQFQALEHVSGQVTGKVECGYCRMFTFYDMVKSAEVHWRLQRGERWLAFKAYVEKETKKYYWLAPARIFQPTLGYLLWLCKRKLHRQEARPLPDTSGRPGYLPLPSSQRTTPQDS